MPSNPTGIAGVALLGCLFFPAPSAAQQKPWRVKPIVAASAEYDDNVFLLDPSDKARIAAGAPALRYVGMEAAGDVVSTLRAEVEFSGPGLRGRSLSITPQVQYDRYLVNTDRSVPQLAATVSQDLPNGSRLRISAGASPSTFFKNYLADGVDADASGGISSSERIYAPGAYAERQVSADYRLRLKKASKASPDATFLQIGSGYYRRDYDAPFARRDQSGPEASLAILHDRGRGELRVGYYFASLGATPGRAVLILDEPDFGVDLNGNGTVTDRNVRAVRMVDHSRTEHAIALAAKLPAGTHTDLLLDYELRRRTFGSTQPFDVSNNGRRDSRHALGAGLSVRLTPSVRFVVSGQLQRQSVNKPLDAAGDVTDYSRHRFSAGMRYAY